MSQKPPKAPEKRCFNRELSWLDFNQRVLDEALASSTPLLERVKFLCITFSNLDEFFEVRVASLKQQVEGGGGEPQPDGLSAAETLSLVRARAVRLTEDAYRCWREVLLPALEQEGIRFRKPEQLTGADQAWLDGYFWREVHPALTPLAIDPSHPFPQLLNKSLNLYVSVETERDGQILRRRAVVQAPRALPRLVSLPRPEGGGRDYVFLADLIGSRLADLFTGASILGWWSFRVTRNSELYIDEDDASNLLAAVEEELRNRRRGAAVRLEAAADAPAEIVDELRRHLQLEPGDCFLVDGPVNPTRLMALLEDVQAPALRDPRFTAAPRPDSVPGGDLFATLRERDILLHHPYESFGVVIDFLEKAAADPQVVAIKQTLYRTGGDPRIVGALMEAVRNNKQVTAVVELKARFDEANNIRWARALEEAGVHVVYGLVGYKIHCKMALVVRAEPGGIRRYLHLGTGNYNPSTARLYTDLSLLTSRPEFGEDANGVFNLLTGISQFRRPRQLVVAHFEMRERVIGLIQREAAHARAGLPARIIAKMNALVEPTIIDELYLASEAGVEIDLIIRGVCCLRPGVPGMSERIRVRSILDRFLEHSRVWYFENARQSEVFVGSADWMPRNLYRRIEVAFPVLDGRLRDRVIHEILEGQLADNVKARRLGPDGVWTMPPPPPGEAPRRSQTEFMALASMRSSSDRRKRPAAAVAVRRSP